MQCHVLLCLACLSEKRTTSPHSANGRYWYPARIVLSASLSLHRNTPGQGNITAGVFANVDDVTCVDALPLGITGALNNLFYDMQDCNVSFGAVIAVALQQVRRCSPSAVAEGPCIY
jgi:hypothetical protein